MAATKKANLGLVEGWATHDTGWGDPLNANLVALDALIFMSVKSMSLSTPPTSPAPAEGDRYVVAASPTGDWSTATAGQIAAYYDGAWVFFTPKDGWSTKFGSDYYDYNGTTWAVRAGSSGGGIPEAPTDGGIYSRQNSEWVEINFISEAPDDGNGYVRKNKGWVLATGGGASALSGLSDVAVAGVADAQLLGFGATASKWTPRSLRLTPSPATLTAWDPSYKAANISLQQSNAQARKTDTSGYSAVLGTVALTVDTYFEMYIDTDSQSPYASVSWGIATRAASLTSDIRPQAANVMGVSYTSDGGMYQNGQALKDVYLGNVDPGSTLCFAFKASTREVWVRVYDGTTLNPWNGDNTADPVAGTGGLAVGGTDVCYPFFGTSLFQIITWIRHANFTQPVPTGYVGFAPPPPDAIPLDVSITNPSNSQYFKWDTASGKFINADLPYDIITYYPGVLTASARLMSVLIARACTLPATAPGSIVQCETPPNATATCTIQKVSSGSATAIGTASFLAGAQTATITVTTAVDFAPGDSIRLIGPATADVAMSDISAVFVAKLK